MSFTRRLRGGLIDTFSITRFDSCIGNSEPDCDLLVLQCKLSDLCVVDGRQLNLIITETAQSQLVVDHCRSCATLGLYASKG